MNKMILLSLTLILSSAWARQEGQITVTIVYPENTCNNYISCNSSGTSSNSCQSQFLSDKEQEKKDLKAIERARILRGTLELEKREKEAVEARERERVRKFLEDQKQVQVPPEKDEFRTWKTLKEVRQERNAFEEWKETNWHKSKPKPKEDFKQENESFISLLEKVKKDEKIADEPEKKQEQNED
jgi:hypothetical protein